MSVNFMKQGHNSPVFILGIVLDITNDVRQLHLKNEGILTILDLEYRMRWNAVREE